MKRSLPVLHIGTFTTGAALSVAAADSADFAGAQVQVRADLMIGENSLCSEGAITLTPR